MSHDAAARRDLRLDGIRGIAVLAVLAYHATAPGAPGGRLLVGGWLGVDVFFVLSGYLITRLLLGEAAAGGTIDRRAFYGRRARRLLPALAVVLVAWLLVTLTGGLPVERLGAGAPHDDPRLALVPVVGSVTLLYNWVLAFELPTPAGMGHLWSLAVEEQFYLLWPTVLVVACARGRRPARALAPLLALGAVVAVFLSASAVAGHARDFAYFSSLTSSLGLLFGAAAALAPRRVLPPAAATGALACLAAAMLLVPDDHPPLLTPATLLACTATTVAILASAGRADRLLVSSALRYAGRRSYALYLWSSPLAYALATWLGEGWAATVLMLGSSFLLAELSWRLVERRWTQAGTKRLEAARRGRKAVPPAGVRVADVEGAR
jgi:peptidoglycan/LPS O-acetylase OafA/YrhL